MIKKTNIRTGDIEYYKDVKDVVRQTGLAATSVYDVLSKRRPLLYKKILLEYVEDEPLEQLKPVQPKLDLSDLVKQIKILEDKLGIQKKTEYVPEIKPFIGDLNNVLIIPDLHIPFNLKDSLEFCKQVQIEYNCGTIVITGDLTDSHATSYHESNPDGSSPGDELKLAIDEIGRWYKAFPDAHITLGSHDKRVLRKNFSSMVSKNWIRPFQEVYNTPNWEYVDEFIFNDILFIHGDGSQGDRAAYARALERRMSVVQAHQHSIASIRWSYSDKGNVFGMTVGSLIDDKKYAFDYSRNYAKKSVLTCGVISKNIPILIPYGSTRGN